MARKNILSGLMGDDRPAPTAPETEQAVATPRASTKTIGALGAVTRSIDQLAARADAAREIEAKLAAGAAVVDLDTNLIDDSFIRDRAGYDEDDLGELVEAFRAHGQDSPILVRPHPTQHGRYQVAFGHRRLRAARALGIAVRAVVKVLEDRDHVIAQGQENSARADLAFIEKAMFAHRLEQGNFGRDVIMMALGADKTSVSKMLSAIERFPDGILETIQTARKPGRDRWYELAIGLNEPSGKRAASALVNTPAYLAAADDERFEMLERAVAHSDDKPTNARRNGVADSVWMSSGQTVRAAIKNNGKRVSIALQSNKKSDQAAEFGTYLVDNLDKLFAAFEEAQRERNNGD